MKHLLIFLLVFPFLASAQILEKQFVATVQYGGFTQINDSLYRGDLNEFRDVLIEGYQPSGVDSGFICLDATGRAYRVEVVNSFDYSSLNVDLVELDDYDEIPIGVGIVAERYGSTYQIPNGLVNSIGISAVLQAKILNHNTKIAATTVQPPDTLYLQELSGTSAISDGDTIPLIDYVRVVDTPAMLLNYPSTAGYGIIDGGKTWRADTTSPNGLATRKYTLLNPTSIIADRSIRSNGTNLVAGNITDNGTKLEALKPWQFQSWTTAGRPTGVNNYWGYNSTTDWIEGYLSSAGTWISPLQSALTGGKGTSGYFPRFDSNGRAIDSEARVSGTNMIIALTGGLQIPSGTSAQQASTGAGYLRWNTSLGYPTIFNGSSTQSVLIGPFTGFASGEVMYGASSGGMPSSTSTFKWDIANSRLLVGTTSYSFSSLTRFVVQQSTANAFIADFRQTSSTAFAPLALMKLTRTDNTVGYGGTFAFYFNNSASTEVDYARFGSLIETNTSGSHSGALAFYTTAAAVTTNERMRISSIGRIGINTTTPTHRLHVNGRARIDTTDATPTSILGIDGNNVLGKFTLGSGLSISSGTLSATGTGGTVTSVALSLPSIFSVSGSPITTSGTISASFTGGTSSQLLRGDGIWSETIDYLRVNQSLSSVERFEVNGNLVLARNDEGHKLMLSRGWSQQIWGGGSTGDMTYQNGSGPGFQNYFVVGSSATVDTVVTMHTSGLGVQVGKSNKIQARIHTIGSSNLGSNKNLHLEESTGIDLFTVLDNGTFSAWRYGAGNKEAADLSKTQSNYIAGFATDGTVLDLERKRDTTIYVIDTDYDFSAALTTTHVGNRYNRVIFLMTTTAAAGSDSELTLHTPDANLMQVEYLVRSTDEAGGFANKIVFGTNNAVDSTNGLVTNYFPAAGQGVGIRAGLRSAAYKYFYY